MAFGWFRVAYLKKRETWVEKYSELPDRSLKTIHTDGVGVQLRNSFEDKVRPRYLTLLFRRIGMPFMRRGAGSDRGVHREKTYSTQLLSLRKRLCFRPMWRHAEELPADWLCQKEQTAISSSYLRRMPSFTLRRLSV